MDKELFTAAIKCCKPVGITGEGAADSGALRTANVGFCMGRNGCAVAQASSDIIITDDDYTSTKNALKWGRNLYDNIRKFVQFQMTVNITCLVFVIFCGVTVGHSPFTVFQLLWINLIMDVLAAIALATEAPHPTKLKKEKIRPKKD